MLDLTLVVIAKNGVDMLAFDRSEVVKVVYWSS